MKIGENMFKKIFIDLCNSKKESPTAVCMKLGLSNAAFSSWTDNTVPRKATLQRIADYFGVSVDYLLGKTEEHEKPAQVNGSISIRSRDGSVVESELDDEKIELFKNMLKQIKDKK